MIFENSRFRGCAGQLSIMSRTEDFLDNSFLFHLSSYALKIFSVIQALVFAVYSKGNDLTPAKHLGDFDLPMIKSRSFSPAILAPTSTLRRSFCILEPLHLSPLNVNVLSRRNL